MNPLLANTVIIQDQLDGKSRWLCFQSPVEIVVANRLSEVMSGLQSMEKLVAEGLYAVGFLSYEAASGIDKTLKTSTASSLPYLWFGLYKGYEEVFLPENTDDFVLGEWQSTVSFKEYEQGINQIKTRIRNGDTYQVNYTFRLRTEFSGNPWSFFVSLYKAQRSNYSAFINLPGYTICSVSPELFFSLNDRVLISRPMKGTISRGLTYQEDRQQVEWLRSSAKNRAENIMIVDMIRNDMSKVAELGTVQVENLFAIETYPTVHQMTSSVSAITSASVTDILRAMFPCASITGAPKVASMEIIANLEAARSIYTGCIGYVAPRRAQFNVAIRTVLINTTTNSAEYGVGGGIVWDSKIAEEYQECLTKASILTQPLPKFDLLESLLWEPQHGYFLLDEHLHRLAESAHYFDIPLSLAQVRQALEAVTTSFGNLRQKVRLTVSPAGSLTLQAQALKDIQPSASWNVGIATKPVDHQTSFLYHKTTYRLPYVLALKSQPECRDVFLWNQDGLVTESTIANIVIATPTGLITPPIKCGLLPGTFRAWLLSQGKIKEGTITLDELRNASTVFLINSVRGWMRLEKAAMGDVWKLQLNSRPFLVSNIRG